MVFVRRQEMKIKPGLGIVFLFALLFSCSLPARNPKLYHGTTIVAETSRDSVWIFADTRLLERGETNDIHHTVNKIHQTKDVFYACAGYVLGVNEGSNDSFFNAPKIIGDIVANNNDIETIYQQAELVLKQRFTSVLPRLNNKQLARMFATGNNKISYVIAQFKNGRRFTASGKIELKPNKNIVADSRILEDNRFVLLGKGDSIRVFMRTNDQYYRTAPNRRKLLYDLVYMECIKSYDVDTPITSVVLYNNGYKWINRLKQ